MIKQTHRCRTVATASRSARRSPRSLALAGCGGAGSGLTVPTVAPAKVFSLGGFQPSTPVDARPSGHRHVHRAAAERQAADPVQDRPGPHTGVHLIIVRDDLAYIIHQHPPIGPNGLLRQTVTFPAPGPYRVLVDVYPNIPGGQPNFQLFTNDQRHRHLPAAAAAAVSSPTWSSTATTSTWQPHPALHAIQAQFINVEVTDPHGHKPTFVPGSARSRTRSSSDEGSLDYFHTHICAPERAELRRACPAWPQSRISGSSTAPGKLTIGVLLPVPGTWRLFLQMKLGGRIVTAPYTLDGGVMKPAGVRLRLLAAVVALAAGVSRGDRRDPARAKRPRLGMASGAR